jgi:hypothetical protein
MGYRSEIAYYIRGTEEDITTLFATHSLKYEGDPAVYKECMGELRITTRGVYFHTVSTKWYDEYPKVQWHSKLWNLAWDMENAGTLALTGQLIRVGEDDDDDEQHRFGGISEQIYISRKIELDDVFPAFPAVTP